MPQRDCRFTESRLRRAASRAVETDQVGSAVSVDLDDVVLVRCVDHLALRDDEPHMPWAVRRHPEEGEVARLFASGGDRWPVPPLVGGYAWDVDACCLVRAHGQSGAVERAGPFGSPDIRFAELGVCVGDGGCCLFTRDRHHASPRERVHGALGQRFPHGVGVRPG